MRQPLSLAVIVGFVAAWGCSEGGSASESAASALAHQRDVLQAELELADGEAPYLLLDRTGSRLILKLRATTLREYPLLAQGERVPRVAFVPVGAAAESRSRVWKGGRLDPAPQRVQREIVPPTDAPADTTAAAGDEEAEPVEEEPAVMPPLPEEQVPAPEQYTIRFGEEFSLEVRTSPLPRGGSLADLGDVLTGNATPGLSVVMPSIDAGALYRSLGEEIALIVR